MEELVYLFKRHGYWKVNLFVFVMMCVSLVSAIVFSSWTLLVNAVWCGISIFSDYVICVEKEERLAVVKELDDYEDKLCVAHHEIERLALEVETYKAAEESQSSAESKKQNPIKSNRIVSDKTFAVRLRSFAQGVSSCDAAVEEEKEYMQYVAERLLSWQTKTVRKDSDEYRYLQRLGLMPALAEQSADNISVNESKSDKKRPASKRKLKKESKDEQA